MQIRSRDIFIFSRKITLQHFSQDYEGDDLDCWAAFSALVQTSLNEIGRAATDRPNWAVKGLG